MNKDPQEKSVRTLRVGEQVRHVLSEILQRGDVRRVERAWSDIRLGDRKGVLMLRPDEP